MLLAARLVYGQKPGLSQSEAAIVLQRRLGLREAPNQATISRLLARAEDEGIIRVTVHPPPMLALEEELRELLCERGPLRDVVVAPRSLSGDSDDKNEGNLAVAAATYLLARVEETGEPTRITVSCGETLAATVDEFMRLLLEKDARMDEGAKRTLQVFPLTLHADYRLMFVYPTTVVTALSRLTGRLRNYDLAAYATSLPIDFHSRDGRSKEQYASDRAEFLQRSQVQELILDEARIADIFLCGIGTTDNDVYRTILKRLDSKLESPERYAAEVGYVPILADGRYSKEVAAEVVGVSIDQLKHAAASRNKHVIAVAGGEKKKEAVRAALKAKCFNVLITDEVVAAHLLSKERSAGRLSR